MTKGRYHQHRRTGAATLSITLGTSKLNINEVDLQLLLSLDANEKGRATSGSNDFVGEVDGLEDEGEGTLLRDAIRG